jgi:transcriptional regulator with XRE-family HTH domain
MRHYPSNSSPNAEKLARFRRQMADFARGERLRQLREARHLSQEDAAHEIGVSVKSVRSWEHGGGIKWENAKTAGEFYAVDPESLVTRELPLEVSPETRLATIERKLDLILDHFDLADVEELEELADENGQGGALPGEQTPALPDEDVAAP